MKMGNWKYLQPVGFPTGSSGRFQDSRKRIAATPTWTVYGGFVMMTFFEIRIGRYSIWSCTVPHM